MSSRKLKLSGRLPVPREKDIQNSIIEWLRWNGAFVWQNDSTGVWDPVRKVYRKRHGGYFIKGVADILGIWRGRPLAIEVKRPGEYPNDDQRTFLRNFNKAGGIGMVARSIEDVMGRLRDERPCTDDNG